MSDDLVVYGDGAFGREISSGLPESHLAFVDSQHLATRERVARARHYWPERDPADFEAYGTTGRRIADRVTGEQLVLEESDPFQVEKPEQSWIAFFVQSGGWLFFCGPVTSMTRRRRGGRGCSQLGQRDPAGLERQAGGHRRGWPASSYESDGGGCDDEADTAMGALSAEVLD